ncbi:MAG: hypothetical protein V9G13_12270 [Marmoricola sp.]
MTTRSHHSCSAGRAVDTDATPILMGVVNLSRDSAYRESIAVE